VSGGVTLTLYSKPGCHLCEDARALVDELRGDFGLTVTEVDITLDDELFSRYRYDIPVLLLNDREIARGRITEVEVISMLERETRHRPGRT